MNDREVEFRKPRIRVSLSHEPPRLNRNPRICVWRHSSTAWAASATRYRPAQEGALVKTPTAVGSSTWRLSCTSTRWPRAAAPRNSCHFYQPVRLRGERPCAGRPKRTGSANGQGAHCQGGVYCCPTCVSQGSVLLAPPPPPPSLSFKRKRKSPSRSSGGRLPERRPASPWLPALALSPRLISSSRKRILNS